MTPFVLAARRRLPPESEPSPEHVYDEHLQLWINRTSGLPLVSEMSRQPMASQFGETTVTETREGVDQSEITTIQSTKFGETTITATAEGVDQSELTAFEASQFGETTLTKTAEGIDQSELGHESSQFGETTFTRTHEGADQDESVGLEAA
jgi:hypothetical protein